MTLELQGTGARSQLVLGWWIPLDGLEVQAKHIIVQQKDCSLPRQHQCKGASFPPPYEALAFVAPLLNNLMRSSPGADCGEIVSRTQCELMSIFNYLLRS